MKIRGSWKSGVLVVICLMGLVQCTGAGDPFDLGLVETMRDMMKEEEGAKPGS